MRHVLYVRTIVRTYVLGENCARCTDWVGASWWAVPVRVCTVHTPYVQYSTFPTLAFPRRVGDGEGEKERKSEGGKSAAGIRTAREDILNEPGLCGAPGGSFACFSFPLPSRKGGANGGSQEAKGWPQHPDWFHCIRVKSIRQSNRHSAFPREVSDLTRERSIGGRDETRRDEAISRS